MNNKNELPPDQESEVTLIDIELAFRAEDDLFEIPADGVRVEDGRVVEFTKDIQKRHTHTEEDIEVLIEPLKAIGVHGYYSEYKTEDQDEILGDLCIYASDLNRALRDKSLEIMEDPDLSGSYDMTIHDDRSRFIHELTETKHF